MPTLAPSMLPRDYTTRRNRPQKTGAAGRCIIRVMNLSAQVRRYIEERQLLAPGARVVLGVSGGPDSLCLLDLLHGLRSEWQLSLHVAHPDHGLRPGADAEAGFV